MHVCGHVFNELLHINITDSEDQPKSLVSHSEGTEKSAAEAAASYEDQSEQNKSPKRKSDENIITTTKKVNALLTCTCYFSLTCVNEKVLHTAHTL